MLDKIFIDFHKWFKENNLTDSYDPKINAKYCMSEMIELIRINRDREEKISEEELAEKFIELNNWDVTTESLNSLTKIIKAIDSNLDNIIYSLNYLNRILNVFFDISDPEEVHKYITELMGIILTSAKSKSGGKNADGKYTKGDNYIPPEPEMTKLLESKYKGEIK